MKSNFRLKQQSVLVILLFGVSMLVSACAASHGESGVPTTSKALKAAAEHNKVSAKIRSMIEALRSAGITRENALERNAASYSTTLVKVNKKGFIHVYIHVKTLNHEVIVRLKEKDVTIELINERLNLIQAWIPFDLIETIAHLEFVERIEPPHYAVTQ